MTCARKILLSLALVILGLGFSSDTHAADILYTRTFNPVDTGTATYASGTTTAAGTIQRIDVSIGQAVGSNSSWTYELRERDNETATYGSCNSIDSLTAAERGVPQLTNNDYGSETRIVSFEMQGAGCTKTANSKASFYLFVNNNIVGGVGRIAQYTGSTDATGNQYMIIYANTTGTTTRIISENTPTRGSISTTTNVVFDFTYFNNSADSDPVSYSGIEWQDLTNGAIGVPTEIPINVTGTGTFRKSITLQSTSSIMWRPYLRNNDSTRYVYGNYGVFSVVSNPAPVSLYTEPFATSTATSTQYQYLNIVSLIQNKHPIAYIPQSIALLQSEATLTGTSSFPSMSFDFTNTRLGSTTLGLTQIDMFSTTTITHFMSEDQIDAFKNLITAIVWVGVVGYLISDVRRTLFGGYK